MLIGYVRVSSVDQNTARQEVLMQELNVEKVFIDKVSGKNTNREALNEMMTFVREGDTVVAVCSSFFFAATLLLIETIFISVILNKLALSSGLVIACRLNLTKKLSGINLAFSNTVLLSITFCPVKGFINPSIEIRLLFLLYNPVYSPNQLEIPLKITSISQHEAGEKTKWVLKKVTHTSLEPDTKQESFSLKK